MGKCVYACALVYKKINYESCNLLIWNKVYVL